MMPATSSQSRSTSSRTPASLRGVMVMSALAPPGQTPCSLAFAIAVFALSVVSLPMMLDRSETDVATALVTSLWAVRENPVVMLFWAGIIVALIAIGYLTAFIGLAVFFPLLGHATWRAYQDLVPAEGS